MAKGNHSHLGDNMRNVHFKSRTFVLVGLVLMGFASFSYWGLTTQNSDLLVKVEQLEDNVKIGTRKQRDLEDELQSTVKKFNELQRAHAKLQSELQQKENLISAQGVEGSQWRDKVRNAEAEVEKFKTAIADKTKKLQDVQKQLSTYAQDISAKDLKLSEAQELIKQLQSGSLGDKNSTAQFSKVKNQTTTTSPQSAADPSLVLAKPNSDDADEKKLEKLEENEMVGARPVREETAVGVKPDEEMELVDPKQNVVEHPEVENDEAKFKEIQEDMEIGEPEKNNLNGIDTSKEANEANETNINEPNLINSQGDQNLDDEPALVDTNPRFRNFKARVMHKKQAEEDNLPEDQEVENEHEDERGDN